MIDGLEYIKNDPHKYAILIAIVFGALTLYIYKESNNLLLTLFTGSGLILIAYMGYQSYENDQTRKSKAKEAKRMEATARSANALRKKSQGRK